MFSKNLTSSLIILILIYLLSFNQAYSRTKYYVPHNFSLNPHFPDSLLPPVVTYTFYNYAMEADNCGTDPTISYDTFVGVVNPEGSFPFEDDMSHEVGPDDSWAIGQSNIIINAYTSTSPVTGRIIAQGCVDAAPPCGEAIFSDAIARSTTMVTVRGRQLNNGQICYTPAVACTVSHGIKERAKAFDPIVAAVTYLDNDSTIVDTLLSIFFEIGEGIVTWNNDTLSNTATDFLLDVNLTGQWALQQGTIRLVAENGVIIESEQTGIFNTLVLVELPQIGDSSNFTAHIENELCFEYDTQVPEEEENVEIGINFDDGGDINEQIIIDSYAYLPGDANMYAGGWQPAVIGSDVTFLVGYFRSASQPCLLDGFYAAGDVNGDCSVFGSDVTFLVQYFRGMTNIYFCPDYQPAWPSPEYLPSSAPSGWPNCD